MTGQHFFCESVHIGQLSLFKMDIISSYIIRLHKSLALVLTVGACLTLGSYVLNVERNRIYRDSVSFGFCPKLSKFAL